MVPETSQSETVELSVVSPVYACGPCLSKLVDEVATAAGKVTDQFELILVDDGSLDNAWESIVELARTRPWLRGIRLSKNFGQHAAISAGIEQASGEWTVVMDCDLQDPPSAIPDLYRTALSSGVDVVFAQRQNRQDRAPKRFTSWAFNGVLTWLTGVKHDESIANFGIFHRNVIDAVVAMPERERAFPLMVKWAGFRSTVMPVQHAARAEGSSSYSVGKMIGLATHVVLGYSDKPLRMVAIGGVLCSLVAFGMVALSLFQFFQGDIQVAGFTSIMASIWLLGGLTLFSLGVVGLYVGQVFLNVQGRPSSITAERVNMRSVSVRSIEPPPSGESHPGVADAAGGIIEATDVNDRIPTEFRSGPFDSETVAHDATRGMKGGSSARDTRA